MTTNHRVAGSVLTSVLGLLLVLALVPVRAGAVVESLRLDPAEGPPNTSVNWVAEGFQDCRPVDDVDSEGVVVVEWDGTQVLDRVRVSAEDGSAASTFLVPESAEFGVHRVTASCLGDGGTDGTEFTVVPPVVVQVLVPNVIGRSEARARRILEAEKFPVKVIGEGDEVQRQNPTGGREVDPGTLVEIELGNARPSTVAVPYLIGLGLEAASDEIRDAGLELGGVSGDRAGLVADQSPRAEAEVLVGATVSISLAPVAPPRVVVPDLVGEPYEGVPGILVAAGLTLGLVSGDVDPDGGTVVVSQQPPADSEVARNSEVSISVEATVVPDPLVVVPDLVGDDVAEARSELTELGLVPGGSDGADGQVTNQQPPPGTLVPLGTPVSLVLEPQSSGRGLVAGLVLLGAAAVATYGPVQRSRDRRWVRHHLDVSPGARTSDASVAVTDDPRSPPTRVVRVVARRDPGTHDLKEGPR